MREGEPDFWVFCTSARACDAMDFAAASTPPTPLLMPLAKPLAKSFPLDSVSALAASLAPSAIFLASFAGLSALALIIEAMPTGISTPYFW